MRGEGGLGGQRIIDDHLHAAAQFEYAAGDDRFASFKAVDHIDKITASLS